MSGSEACARRRRGQAAVRRSRTRTGSPRRLSLRFGWDSGHSWARRRAGHRSRAGGGAARQLRRHDRSPALRAVRGFHSLLPVSTLLRTLLDVSSTVAVSTTEQCSRIGSRRSIGSSFPGPPPRGAVGRRVEPTPEVNDLDPAFWRARLHGVMGKVWHLLDPDAARLRRRPLDGRRVVRTAALPRHAAPDAAVAHLHDAAADRRRVRCGRGNATAPGTDTAARAAPAGGRENARSGRGRRPPADRRGAGSSDGTRRRESALPPAVGQRR
jgi:hypothetical protein